MTSVWISPELLAGGRGIAPAATVAVSAPEEVFVLRRSGRRPLRFAGMLMIEHAGVAADGGRRHAIRIYETTSSSLVIEIALESESLGALAHIVTEEVDSMAAAEEFLRSYDPAEQAALLIALHGIGTGGVVAQAAALEREALRLRADFDSVRAAVFAAAGADDKDMNDTAERIN
jgi:hypothetical protein